MMPLTRSEAKQVGSTRYNTGMPCLHGHTTDRLTSNGVCNACAAERKAKWNAANLVRSAARHRDRVAAKPDHYKRLKAESSRRNPEAQAKRSRAWYLRNKEKSDSASKQWIKENPGKVNARAARIRAEKLERTVSWADLDLIDDIYSLARVLREHGLAVEVDHEIPLRGRNVCGLHTHHNLRLLDSKQNKSKSNRFSII